MLKTNQAQDIFTQFCTAYKNRDLQALLKLFTKNSNMWGSGLDEYRIGLKQIEEQIKRDWSQSDKAEIEIVSFVPAPKEATWVAAICNAKVTVDGQQHVFKDFRGTIILEQEEGIWKIAHSHASFPDYRNAENGSFPVAN